MFSRLLLRQYAELVKGHPADVSKQVCNYSTEKLRRSGRLIAFEEEFTVLLEHLANVYEEERDYSTSISYLRMLIDRQGNLGYVIDVNLRIANLYLELEEPHSAEQFAYRALGLSHTVNLDIKLCIARAMKLGGKYLQAALRFFELSQSPGYENQIGDAVICTILARPSPSRFRLLNNLHNNQRCVSLDFYDILVKVRMERLLTKSDVERFSKHLKPVQMDNLWMLESNLIAASRVYHNITFFELGSLLDISPEQAETLAAEMITRKTLSGRIDQLTGRIFFEVEDPLRTWDRRIEQVCLAANAIVAEIGAKYPMIVDGNDTYDRRPWRY